jgi:plasmid stabilization system protein ParE
MREPLGVVLQHRAAREIEAVDQWWRANRRAAPDLFVSELDAILSAIALMPTLGSPAKAERASGVRRVALRRTRYYVYYRVHDDVIEVLAVWHKARGVGPGV